MEILDKLVEVKNVISRLKEYYLNQISELEKRTMREVEVAQSLYNLQQSLRELSMNQEHVLTLLERNQKDAIRMKLEFDRFERECDSLIQSVNSLTDFVP